MLKCVWFHNLKIRIIDILIYKNKTKLIYKKIKNLSFTFFSVI